MMQASADAHVPTCTSGSSPGRGQPPTQLRASPGWWCDCRSSCANSKALAIIEKDFVTCKQIITRMETWENPIWVALVRDPESWFYSAVGHYCSTKKWMHEEPCAATIQ